MKNRVYIHAPTLPRTLDSLTVLFGHLKNLPPVEIVVCHNAGTEDRILKLCPHAQLRRLPRGPEAFEYPTLRQLWQDAQNEDFHALYVHAKGSSKTEPEEFVNAKAWMHWMALGVVGMHFDCQTHLNAGADLVGSQYHWHFKGNFWWGRSDYLRKLPDPYTLDVSNRLDAEYWSCWGLWIPDKGFPLPRVKNLYYVQGMSNDIYTGVSGISKCSVFVDRRVGTDGVLTVSEFLASKEKRAFDRALVLPEDAGRLRNYFNYDAKEHVVK